VVQRDCRSSPSGERQQRALHVGLGGEIRSRRRKPTDVTIEPDNATQSTDDPKGLAGLDPQKPRP
jgi:hypothetical protein